MKYIQKIFFVLIGSLLIYSCYQEPDYPNEPEIEFSRIVQVNKDLGEDSVMLEITFRDGDGDLGLSGNRGEDLYPEYGEFLLDGTDTLFDQPNKFHNNYFIDVLKKGADGEFEKVEFLQGADFNSRFPILNTLGNETALEGELRFSIEILIPNRPSSSFPLLRGDVVKFEIQIADRAKNLSNIVETDSIVVGEPQNPVLPPGGE